MSSIFPPRSRRGDCSPSTQRTASEMVDLPHPLGPTIAVTPASNGSSTVPANDLKPDSSSRVNLMVWSSCGSREWRGPGGGVGAAPRSGGEGGGGRGEDSGGGGAF